MESRFLSNQSAQSSASSVALLSSIDLRDSFGRRAKEKMRNSCTKFMTSFSSPFLPGNSWLNILLLGRRHARVFRTFRHHVATRPRVHYPSQPIRCQIITTTNDPSIFSLHPSVGPGLNALLPLLKSPAEFGCSYTRRINQTRDPTGALA
jgi:hypothetical protein